MHGQTSLAADGARDSDVDRAGTQVGGIEVGGEIQIPLVIGIDDAQHRVGEAQRGIAAAQILQVEQLQGDGFFHTRDVAVVQNGDGERTVRLAGVERDHARSGLVIRPRAPPCRW